MEQLAQFNAPAWEAAVGVVSLSSGQVKPSAVRRVPWYDILALQRKFKRLCSDRSERGFQMSWCTHSNVVLIALASLELEGPACFQLLHLLQ